MLSSINEWCDVPIIRLPFIKIDGAGDSTYGEPVTIYAYPVSEVKVVKNKLGVEVTSNTQLYMDGTETVSEFDDIIFEGNERPILAISTFYKDGQPDLKVVYL